MDWKYYDIYMLDDIERKKRKKRYGVYFFDKFGEDNEVIYFNEFDEINYLLNKKEQKRVLDTSIKWG